jgi:hypothetical protein
MLAALQTSPLPRKIPGTYFFYTPGAIMRLEGLGKLKKNPVTSLRSNNLTFQLVA